MTTRENRSTARPRIGRANTTIKKLKVLSTLFRAWRKYPQLRFGQLIVNIVQDEGSVFYIEDMRLANQAEKYVNRRS